MRAGKGDSMVTDMKELEKFRRVRNSCSKTHCNGSHHVEKLSKNIIFPIADGTVKLSGRDQVFQRST